MPRGRRSGGFSRPAPAPRAPARPPPPTKAPAPRPPTQVASPAPQQSAGSGLLGNIASTAAGVAIGHTIGHAITGGLSGGGHAEQPVAEQPTYAAQQPAQQQWYPPQQNLQAGNNPCAYELDQFLQCAQNQPDFTLCQGFNDVLRQCKLANGLA